MSNYKFDAFQDLSEIIEQYINGADNAMEGIEEGAKEFINDALKLPKPISQIRKAGYTHLVDSFSYRRKPKEIEAGWGKYYGPMLENGTVKMDAKPHLNPLWERNREKYYKTMLTRLGIKNW